MLSENNKFGAIFGMLVGLLLVTLVPQGYAQTAPDGGRVVVDAPGTALWEAARLNTLPANSQVPAADGGRLIYTDGIAWLKFRRDTIMPVLGYALGAVLLAIFLFWLVRGSIPVPGGESGKRVVRTVTYERVIHWTMAAVFMLLAITGFLVLYGRPLLIPVLGNEVYSVIASASKSAHNLFGIIFPLTILLMFVQFVRRNLYARGDLGWLAKGGGIVTKAHLSAGYFNMGEKIMFWLVIFCGVLMSTTGLVLDFPVFDLSRANIVLAYKIHAIVAGFFVILVCGHIYLAVVGVKGTLSSMTDGTVDENWARAHHDLWYQELNSEQDGET